MSAGMLAMPGPAIVARLCRLLRPAPGLILNLAFEARSCILLPQKHSGIINGSSFNLRLPAVVGRAMWSRIHVGCISSWLWTANISITNSAAVTRFALLEKALNGRIFASRL